MDAHMGSFGQKWGRFGVFDFKQEKGPGSASPRPAHFCPQCGQFWGTGSGGGKTGMGTVKGTVGEKSQCFQAFQGCHTNKICVPGRKS